MHNDILKKLDALLTETSWNDQKNETLKDVRDMREDGLRAEDVIQDNVDEDEEKNVSTDNENKESDENESDQNDSDEEEDLQKVVNLEDASSYEKIEDALNLFKSGKSLSNEDIKEEMKAYHEKLTPNDKKKADLKMKNSKEEAENGINTPITIGEGVQEKREILKIVKSNG